MWYLFVLSLLLGVLPHQWHVIATETDSSLSIRDVDSAQRQLNKQNDRIEQHEKRKEEKRVKRLEAKHNKEDRKKDEKEDSDKKDNNMAALELKDATLALAIELEDISHSINELGEVGKPRKGDNNNTLLKKKKKDKGRNAEKHRTNEAKALKPRNKYSDITTKLDNLAHSASKAEKEEEKKKHRLGRKNTTKISTLDKKVALTKDGKAKKYLL